ncbi:unnamed protein product [Lota lota]
MPGTRRRRPTVDAAGLWLWLVVCFVASPVSPIMVSSPPELHASKGESVLLSCTFTSISSPTSRMSVDWSYRPPSGGAPQTFFHFSSKAFPPADGQFTGRIRWQGSPARGEASITLVNATLADNGTFTCGVWNPPDVHGSPTSHTVLSVTPKAASVRFSDVGVLLVLVLLPSALVTLGLIARMCCPQKEHHPKAYRSPIEVTEEDEYAALQMRPNMKNKMCSDLDKTGSEEGYYSQKIRPPVEEGTAESQC